jgi:hypothetical protein
MLSFDDMLGTGTRGSKHGQHVSHCLSALRLNSVEQFPVLSVPSWPPT